MRRWGPAATKRHSILATVRTGDRETLPLQSRCMANGRDALIALNPNPPTFVPFSEACCSPALWIGEYFRTAKKVPALPLRFKKEAKIAALLAHPHDRRGRGGAHLAWLDCSTCVRVQLAQRHFLDPLRGDASNNGALTGKLGDVSLHFNCTNSNVDSVRHGAPG
jgi:hypothetical protein